MQAEELPQDHIDALAVVLLDLAEQGAPAECCSRCSDDANHTFQGRPYCELCRGCYPDTPAD
jgi:hypothetical protein